MVRRALALVGLLIVGTAAVGAFIVVAIRTKSPAMLDVVRRFNRAVTNKLQRTAGEPGSYASLVRHRGRRSGREYETPVVPFPVDGGYLVSLPYGPDTDWVRNVLAAGSAELVVDGSTRVVDQPEVVATDDVEALFPESEQRTRRLFRIDHTLRLRVAGGDTPTDGHP